MPTVVDLTPPDPADWGYVYCGPCADAEDAHDSAGHAGCRFDVVFCGCACPWLFPGGRRPSPPYLDRWW